MIFLGCILTEFLAPSHLYINSFFSILHIKTLIHVASTYETLEAVLVRLTSSLKANPSLDSPALPRRRNCISLWLPSFQIFLISMYVNMPHRSIIGKANSCSIALFLQKWHHTIHILPLSTHIYKFISVNKLKQQQLSK